MLSLIANTVGKPLMLLDRLRSGELDKANKTTVGRAILESTATACSKLIIDELNSI